MSGRFRMLLARPASRSGAILICVLACLAIVTAMVTATIRSALRSHVEVRSQRDLRQTELVLEAGILRARQQVAASRDYAGEIWQLADEVLPGDTPATIEILVRDRSIEVTARLGSNLQQLTQRSFEFTFDEPSPSNKE